MSEEPLDEYELDKLRLAQKKKKKKQQHTGGAKRLRNLEVFASSGSGRKAKAKSPIASGEDDRVNQWRLQLAEEQRQEEEEEERLRAVYQMQIRADEAAGKRSPSNSPMARSVGKRSPMGAASSAGSPLAASQSPGGASAGAAGADVGERFTGEFDWGEQGIGVESARLQQENADLAVALDQRAREVKRLEVVLQTMQPIPGLDPSALLDVLVNGERQEHDIRDLKIVEMAKKIRKVKAALERERATCTALRYEVQQVHLASDLAAVGRGEDAGAVSSARARNAVFGAASPRARAKINAAAEASASAKQQKQKKKQRPRASKEDEYRAKLLEARAEVKRTQRALSREVGPDVPIADVLASVGEADVMGGWRGRAQTITMLRTKLKHTKRKLAAASGERERSSMANDVDVQAVDDLKAMQAARDGAVEALTSQYGAVSTALEGAQEKLKHKKARIRTLEENQRRTKAQLKTMLQKSVNDDGLIDRLTKDAVAYRDAAQDGRRKGEKVILLEKAKGAAEDRARRAENALETSRRKLVAEEAAAQHLRGQVGAAALQQAQAAQASRSGQAVAVRVLQNENSRLRELLDSVGGKFERSNERIAMLEAKVRQHNLQTQESVFGPQGGKKKSMTTGELRVKVASLRQRCSALKSSSREALALKDQQIAAMQAMADEQRRLYENSIDELVGAGRRPTSGSGASGAAHLRDVRKAPSAARQGRAAQQVQRGAMAASVYIADDSIDLTEDDEYDSGRSPIVASYRGSGGGGRTGGVSWQTEDATWDER